MRRPSVVGFAPVRDAWLWGYAPSRAARRLSRGLLAASLGLVAWSAAWWWQQSTVPPAASPRMAPIVADRPSDVGPTAAWLQADRMRFNRIVAQLNTPWAAIFESLERMATPKVSVVSVEPDADRSTVRVQIEGPVLDDLLQSVQHMQGATPLGQARLVQVEERAGPAGPAGVPMPHLDFELEVAR